MKKILDFWQCNSPSKPRSLKALMDTYEERKLLYGAHSVSDGKIQRHIEPDWWLWIDQDEDFIKQHENGGE